jgi:Fe-Mn family superoxide dismutase
MKHILPKLPFEMNALEPFMDAKTVEVHYGKHHQTYVDKLNMALDKHPSLFSKDIKELLGNLNAVPEEIRTAVKNNGGGVYNHNIFWEVLTGDKKKQKFEGEIAAAIEREFGGFDIFKDKFSEFGLNRFGSGWVWLVSHKGKLEILSTANQDCPISEGKIPLLAMDVWEHSYYLKYLWNRKAYVESFFNIINWTKVNELYEEAIN